MNCNKDVSWMKPIQKCSCLFFSEDWHYVLLSIVLWRSYLRYSPYGLYIHVHMYNFTQIHTLFIYNHSFVIYLSFAVIQRCSWNWRHQFCYCWKRQRFLNDAGDGSDFWVTLVTSVFWWDWWPECYGGTGKVCSLLWRYILEHSNGCEFDIFMYMVKTCNGTFEWLCTP